MPEIPKEIVKSLVPPKPVLKENSAEILKTQQTEQSQAFERPQGALKDHWFERARRNIESKRADLDEGSLTFPTSRDIIENTDLSHLPYLVKEEDIAAFKDYSVEGPKLGFIDSALTGVHDGGVNAYSNIMSLYDPNWRMQVVTDDQGVSHFDNTPLTGAGIRMHGSWAGDPDGFMASLAHTGAELGTGWYGLRLLGASKALDTASGFVKNGAVVKRMSEGLQKATVNLTDLARVSTMEALSAMVTTPIDRQGPLTNIKNWFLSQSGDDKEGYAAYLASEGDDARAVGDHMASVFFEEFMLAVGGGKIIDGLFKTVKHFRSAAVEKKVLGQLEEAKQLYRAKLLPDLKAAFDIHTKDIAKGVKNSDDLNKAIVQLEDTISNIDAVLLNVTETALKSDGKISRVAFLEEQLRRKRAAGDLEGIKILEDQINNWHMKNGGKGPIDNLEGTARRRLEMVAGRNAEDLSSLGHEKQTLLQGLAEKSDEALEAKLKDLQARVKAGDNTLLEDKLFVELLAQKSIKIADDDLVSQFYSKAADSDRLGIWDDGGDIDNVLAGLKKELGLSDAELKAFRGNVSNRPEALRTAWALRAQGRQFRDDLIKWMKVAADTQDDVDILRALHSYNKAISLTAITRKVSSLDGSTLQANQWALEAGEEVNMQLAVIKAKMHKGIDDPLDGGLLQIVRDKGELFEALSKADKKVVTEKAEEIAVIAEKVITAAGGKDKVLKRLTDLRLDSVKNPDGVLANVYKTHNQSTLKNISDAVNSYAINNMLSGPITLTKVALGGAFQYVYIPLSRILGGAADITVQSISKAVGRGSADNLRISLENFQDATLDAFNMIGATLDAIPMGINTLLTRKSKFGGVSQNEFLYNVKTGYSTEALIRKNSDRWESLSAARKAGEGAKGAGTVLYDFIQIPTQNVMQATDEFFKQIFFRSSMRTSLMKKARAEKLFDDPTFNFKKYFDEEMESQYKFASSKEGKVAMDKALTATFQTELKSTAKHPFNLKKLNEVANEIPFMKLIFPFIKTMANMTDEFIESTPLIALSGKLKDTWFFGSVFKRLNDRMMGPENAWKVQANIGKNMMTATLAIVSWQAYQNGKIQGFGPMNRKERENAVNNGELVQYSIEIGDNRYAFSELAEPIGFAFRAITRLYEFSDQIFDQYEQEELTLTEAGDLLTEHSLRTMDTIENIGDHISQEISEVLPLRGPQKAVDALVRGGDARSNFFGDFLGAFMPLSGAIDQTTRIFNPEYSIKKGWKARLQAKSLWDLSPLDAVLGTDFKDHGPVRMVSSRTGAFIDNSPKYLGFAGIKYNLKHDPKLAEFMSVNGAYINSMWRVKDELQNDLSPEQQERYQEIMYSVKIDGHRLIDALDKTVGFIKAEDFNDATTAIVGSDKKSTPAVTMMNKVYSSYRKKADESFYREFPELATAADADYFRKQLISSGDRQAKDLPMLSTELQTQGSVEQHRSAVDSFRQSVQTDPQNTFIKGNN